MSDLKVRYLHFKIFNQDGKTIIQPVLENQQDLNDVLEFLKPTLLELWIDNGFKNNYAVFKMNVFEYSTKKPLLVQKVS